MKNAIKKYLPFIYSLLLRVKSLISLLVNRKFIDSESYFAEYADRRRSRFEIFIDQCKHVLKHGGPNEYYFLYGLDIKDMHKADSYVDYREFMLRRDRLNRLSDNSPVAVLRNKFLFGIFAKALGVDTPNNIGIVEDGKIYLLNTKDRIDFNMYINSNEVDTFIKSIDGECADGVYHLQIQRGKITLSGNEISYSGLCEILGESKYLLQERIYQHKTINDIYSGAINTIRLETVYDRTNRKIEILPPLLRVGTGSNRVDNWAVGGLAIGIDVEGESLHKYGFYKPGYGTKASEHPNSGIVFDGYKIPFLQQAIEQAKSLHSFLPGVHSIGWDIAIGENGPIIIEGNDNWEISLVQICSHGLQQEFDNYFN